MKKVSVLVEWNSIGEAGRKSELAERDRCDSDWHRQVPLYVLIASKEEDAVLDQTSGCIGEHRIDVDVRCGLVLWKQRRTSAHRGSAKQVSRLAMQLVRAGAGDRV